MGFYSKRMQELKRESKEALRALANKYGISLRGLSLSKYHDNARARMLIARYEEYYVQK